MPRIICIDPDAGRAEEPVKVLRAAGYEVMLAFCPEVGVALLRLFPPDIVLLDSDLSEQLLPQVRQASRRAGGVNRRTAALSGGAALAGQPAARRRAGRRLPPPAALSGCLTPPNSLRFWPPSAV